jgi:uncharacterized protein (TIGR02996 family)
MSQDRTELVFLHDICQNPADDGVRLIYADWLDDRGLPGDSGRAEFIRGQIEIARLCQDPAAPWTDFQLLECHRSLTSAMHNGDYEFLAPDWTETPVGAWSWRGHGPQLVVRCGYFAVRYPYPFTLHWRRGFIEAISLSLVDFQAHAARLFASHPVQHVTLTDRKPARLPVARGEVDPGLWGWVNHPGRTMPGPQQFYRLPGCLYDALEGWVHNPRAWRFYRTQAEAQEALARACVRWGRQQAGLLEDAMV